MEGVGKVPVKTVGRPTLEERVTEAERKLNDAEYWMGQTYNQLIDRVKGWEKLVTELQKIIVGKDDIIAQLLIRIKQLEKRDPKGEICA